MIGGRPFEVSDLPDGLAAAVLFAADPHGLGGIIVRSGAGPGREAWLARLKAVMQPGAPVRRVSASMVEERLEDSLDLVASLAAGRPVTQRGLLSQCDGGVMLIPMAERLSSSAAARLGVALDIGMSGAGGAARFGVVALDEGQGDEAVPVRLRDALAFSIDLATDRPGRLAGEPPVPPPETWRAAALVEVGEEIERSLVATAMAIGIVSLRASVMALRVTRIAAALAGRATAAPEDAALAARLVLAPRATIMPAPPADQQDGPEASGPEPQPEADAPREDAGRQPSTTDESVLAAVRSALPPGLLLGLETTGRTVRPKPGGAGAAQVAPTRGRPTGVRRGRPGAGARLNLIETLRAAAPWQAARRAVAPARPAPGQRLLIRGDDLRLTRFKQRSETVTVFAVDASGSLALQRLNEAKGAVELLLAECYVRRDQVALLAFRGTGAELLLPPTRSLARAKRCLAGMVGGGATPLPAALDAVLTLADTVRRRGQTPVAVLFTDGRANVTRDGTIDRGRAEAETKATARIIAAAGFRTLLIDAAPRPQPRLRDLATAMNATYVPLPRTDAATLTAAIMQGSAG